MRGIDVAKWNGYKATENSIDWEKVKNAGCEFAILKVIDGKVNKESAFEENYAGAKKQNIPIGVYNYSYATTVEKARSDAKKVLECIRGKNIGIKIWLDAEDECQKGLGQKLINIINAYQKVIEDAGYDFGIYTGYSFYKSYIKPYAKQINCPFWIARYPSSLKMKLDSVLSEFKKPTIDHVLFSWQYSSSGEVNGINGKVDLNILYCEIEKEEVIGSKNPYEEPEKTVKKGTIGNYAKWVQFYLFMKGYDIVIDGNFGNKSVTALMDFQKKNGLTVDGKCGVITRTYLKK